MSIIQSLSIFRRLSSHYYTTPHIFPISFLSSTSSLGSKTKLDESMKKLIDSKQYKQALELFQQHQKKSQQPTEISINMALKACTLLKDYQRGVQIVKQLSARVQQLPSVQTTLLQFYMHCGDMKNAERLYLTFNDQSDRIYTILFKGFIMNNMPEKVLDVADKMKITPNEYTLTMIFSACAKVKNVHAKKIGMKLFDNMPKRFRTNAFISTTALNMLMSFGEMNRAKEIFEFIKVKNTFHYGSMLKGYIENGMNESALDLFEDMSAAQSGIIHTLVFKACAHLNNERAQKIGRHLLDQVWKKARTDKIMLNSAIHMLMCFGDVSRAEQLFGSLKEKDVVSYGAMIQGYAENDMNLKALDLFETISLKPNDIIHMLIFKACAQLNNERAQKIGEQLLSQILNKPQVTKTALSSAIHMLMCFGEVTRAEQLFGSLKEKNVINYGAMIKGYIENDMNEKALNLFEEASVEANDIIHRLVFKACAQLNHERAKLVGMKLLDKITSRQMTNQVLLTSAVQMLMSFGETNRAEQLFKSIKAKDAICYSVMMKGYVEHDMHEKALDLFADTSVVPNDITYTRVFQACSQLNNERAKGVGMKLFDEITCKEITDRAVLTSAVHMLISFDQIDRAEQLFDSIKAKDAISYNVMMRGYIIHNKPLKFNKLFQQMKRQNTNLDVNMFVILLQACAQSGLPSLGQTVIAEIPRHLLNNIGVVNAMIFMWGKVGRVEDAFKVFDSTHKPDLLTFTNMINAYGLNGRGMEAVNLYQQMPTDLPDEMCHTCVLNACSHAGLVHQARSIFNNINNKTERIYTSMIDCLSRLQMFDEAEQLIQEYEHHSNKLHSPMYMALLSGARNARNLDLSSRIFKKMEQLFPDDKSHLISGSTLVGNIYTSIGDYEQASAIRRHRIEHHGAKIKPGVTWTELDGELVSFTAHDRSHPLADEIYAEAEVMAKELLEHGHQFDASWITRPLKDTETVESVLCGHSERLALAYHFIRGRRPSKIHMVKNLRVCGDCHHATKLIAKIRQCEIIVRDANRIHHFQKNGLCSCMDHF